jgi:hypothetical protein
MSRVLAARAFIAKIWRGDAAVPEARMVEHAALIWVVLA